VKPILFNTDMVKAILDGKKTVTRRLVKPQLPDNTIEIREIDPLGYLFFQTSDSYLGGYRNRKAPYKSGDILYVRETWCYGAETIECLLDKNIKDDSYYYRADGNISELTKWHPSIHMPKEAARIFLKVTNVRVERLQDITEEQAIKEGVTKLYDYLSPEEYKTWSDVACTGRSQSNWGYTNHLWHGHFGKYGTGNKLSDAHPYQSSAYDNAKGSFSSLWNLTVKQSDLERYGWGANPWVWVIEFERISKEVAYAEGN